MNTTKPTTYNNILSKIIKEFSDVCSHPIQKLYGSILQGSVPDAMKLADITPSQKKYDECLKENYRHISMLFSFSKTFETIMYNDIYQYMETIMYNDIYQYMETIMYNDIYQYMETIMYNDICQCMEIITYYDIYQYMETIMYNDIYQYMENLRNYNV